MEKLCSSAWATVVVILGHRLVRGIQWGIVEKACSNSGHTCAVSWWEKVEGPIKATGLECSKNPMLVSPSEESGQASNAHEILWKHVEIHLLFMYLLLRNQISLVDALVLGYPTVLVQLSVSATLERAVLLLHHTTGFLLVSYVFSVYRC